MSTYTTFHAHPHNVERCDVGLCPIEYAIVQYRPSLPADIIYAALLGIILVAQIVLSIRYKTWGFLVGMFCGLVLEVIGYAGRIMMYYNPFPMNNFLVYFVPLSFAPAFLSASIYLSLGRLIIANNARISRLKPRTYTISFITCDLISLLLQSAGGAVTATAGRHQQSLQDAGVNIMIAGLAFQVFSLFLFMTLWAEYYFRLYRHQRSGKVILNRRFDSVRESWRYKGFQVALAAATVLIFVRCVYRVAELNNGFDGSLANNQTIFLILEGPMIIGATGLLTVFHPGFAFKGLWSEAGWSLRGRKGNDLAIEDYDGNLNDGWQGEKLQTSAVNTPESGASALPLRGLQQAK